MPVLEGQEFPLAGQEVRLTFLHTADIHSRLIPYDFAPLKTDTDLGLITEAGPFGGATRMASILRRERAKADRVLHVDSGDCFQGAPIFNVNFGEAEFRFLSDLRLDAAVVGNHEFDAGLTNFVTKARDFARFPLLSANYTWDVATDPTSNAGAAHVTAPYTLSVVKGVRVAIIGMANISSLNSLVEGGNSLQATPLEQNEAARAYVELLRPVSDLIIVVSHLGLTEDQDVVRGYEAYYEYERIKPFVERATNPWKVLEWEGGATENDPKAVVKVFIPGVSGIDAIFGGHLHVVLNPPQTVTDPSGRKVLLVHSGAFAKYVGRADVVLKMPEGKGQPDGAEIVSHEFRVFPMDALWCDDAMRHFYTSRFWNPGEFMANPDVRAAVEKCRVQEDRYTTGLLQPYILGMDYNLNLSSIFAYAPRDVSRRNNSTGGDSPLGNIAADSMRKRRRVEAEMAVTNSLGIRDNLYAGVVSQESMFNVFPFENTINIMYLSGVEVQEMLDFVAERSSERGCVSQAQVSGVRFTMDCAQVQVNDLEIPCEPVKEGADCPTENREGHAPWQCVSDQSGNRCWAHPAIDIQVNGQPIDPNGTYRVAVNDYIAKGGSGFRVLKRNTTRIETGISLRDSLIGYMQGFCTCEDINAGREMSKTGERCGSLLNGKWVVDDQIRGFCKQAQEFKDAINKKVGECTCTQLLASTENAPERCKVPDLTLDTIQNTCGTVPAGPYTGRCSCREVLSGAIACGTVTPQLKSFCENPTSMAVANVVEDGRIGRRVK
ncbi:bifunctional UDP-sugar hydrolase/5'-nucleotidase [Myxococcaceae bacterium GXIMD 01537]